MCNGGSVSEVLPFFERMYRAYNTIRTMSNAIDVARRGLTGKDRLQQFEDHKNQYPIGWEELNSQEKIDRSVKVRLMLEDQRSTFYKSLHQEQKAALKMSGRIHGSELLKEAQRKDWGSWATLTGAMRGELRQRLIGLDFRKNYQIDAAGNIHSISRRSGSFSGRRR